MDDKFPDFEEEKEFNIQELRKIIPKGENPPPSNAKGGSGEAVVPSYENDTENWGDLFKSKGDSDDGDDGDDDSDSDSEDDKDSDDNDGDSDSNDSKDGQGEEGAKDAKERIKEIMRQYSNSISGQIDKNKKEAMDAAARNRMTKQQEDELKKRIEQEKKAAQDDVADVTKAVEKKLSDPREMTEAELREFEHRIKEHVQSTMTDPKRAPDFTKTARSKQTSKTAGRGIGGELMKVGYVPPNPKPWKHIFKNWVMSVIDKKTKGSSWQQVQPRQLPITKHLKSQGYNVKLKQYDVEVDKPTKFKILVFVDVSGSCFSFRDVSDERKGFLLGVQDQFKAVLKGVPKDKADVFIWTFDSQIQEGPFNPKNYNPVKGGGGTEVVAPLVTVLNEKKYKRYDGLVIITDGYFSQGFPRDYFDPKKMCFILTADGSDEYIPKGSKVIHTTIK